MERLPLLPAAPADSLVAYHCGRGIRRSAFLADIFSLAGELPTDGYVLNLCANRYTFAVTFFATIARGAVNLLPSTTASEQIKAVCVPSHPLVIVSDQSALPDIGAPVILLNPDQLGAGTTSEAMPLIAPEQKVARIFTSGSTGQPQPHDKTFSRLFLSAHAEARYLWPITSGACSVLGTVPLRHMYGLESTILLPLVGGGILSSRIPLFAADIASDLAELPEPRLLITTPFHLRKLLESGIVVPRLAAVLSATAPLSIKLAQLAENALLAPVHEIYGSTETGQLATRHTLTDSVWRTFPGITLRQTGNELVAQGGHLECPQPLSDQLELLGPDCFRLIDRNVNVINIVGKRTSLEFLNHLINQIPGVRDAMFCLPQEAHLNEAARLAAFVVAPGMSGADISAALRPQLDAVFLPRPIVFVDALPRDGNGKIPAAALNALIETHIGAANHATASNNISA